MLVPGPDPRCTVILPRDKTGKCMVRTVRIDGTCPVKSIADQLPAEMARQIHPDRRKNEATYWAARDQLLDHYQGQWIGFADGKVMASGTSPVTVFHAAEATGLHPFFICVGREEEPCPIRRATSRRATRVRRDQIQRR
jgi:hypothetical protein